MLSLLPSGIEGVSATLQISCNSTLAQSKCLLTNQCNFPNFSMLKILLLLWWSVGLILPSHRTLLKWSLQLSKERKTIFSNKRDIIFLIHFNNLEREEFATIDISVPHLCMYLGKAYRNFTSKYQNISKIFWWERTVEMKWYGRLKGKYRQMRRIREIRIRNRNLEDRRPRQVKKNILKDSKAWTGSWSKCKGVKEADYYKCSIRRKIVKKSKQKGRK